MMIKQFDKLMLSGSNYVEGGFIGALLSAIGLPLLIKALGSGIHNTPEKDSYKEHTINIPIPKEQQPIVSQTDNKVTALVNDKWQPYNPYNHPKFYDYYEFTGYC